MKAKPGAITLLAILQILAPLGNIWSGAVLSKSHFFTYFFWLKTHDPYFMWSHLWIPVLAAVAIYSTKIWSLPLFVFTLIWNLSRIHIPTSPSNSTWVKLLPILAVLTNALLFIYICLPRVRKIYLDKNQRWWDSVPRFKVNWPCRLIGDEGETALGKINYFTTEGVFVTLNSSALDSLKMGDIQQIRFEFEENIFSVPVKSVSRSAENFNQCGLAFFKVGLTQKIRLWVLSKVLERRKIERRPERVSHLKEFVIWSKSLLK